MQSIKEHNLKANHNQPVGTILPSGSVCNLSKNTIWKQITTRLLLGANIPHLYAIYQRTQSESKSQPIGVMQNILLFCMQSIKEHNLKANHNSCKMVSASAVSVCNLSKNTIWKQITTIQFRYGIEFALYAIYQRTQSESKSQLAIALKLPTWSVCNLSKNTIWKQITTPCVAKYCANFLYAIYQRTQSESKSQLGLCYLASLLSVCNLSKNTIWKQITTQSQLWQRKHTLYAIYQRTQSESKSQRVGEKKPPRFVCMQSIKEHNLKANHNMVHPFYHEHESVCNLSKNTIWKQITTGSWWHFHELDLYAIYQRTQSESKSQRISDSTLPFRLCMQSIKEHNLKANHNGRCLPSTFVRLYAIYQRTQSESKSQLLLAVGLFFLVCMQSIKEHNLKANHNRPGRQVIHWTSVCNLSKNTIWKQITTNFWSF